MTLPPDFQFSQGSLQDYVDCPRRFQLRYLLRVAWPAIEAEPALENEHHLQQGAAFHRLVHQHLLGIVPERLSGSISDPDLARWWHNYLAAPPPHLPPSRYPESVLSAPVGGTGLAGHHRLVATYDLVAVDAGQRAVIVDWKTFRQRPQRKWLAGRLQTHVYPYLLVRAGRLLNAGQSLPPEQVEMLYWFANFPEAPQRFAYDVAQYHADEAYLGSLIEEIGHRGDGDFPLTVDERRCRYCAYRSLCQRGTTAGTFEAAEDELESGDDLDLVLEFEQIAEVAY